MSENTAAYNTVSAIISLCNPNTYWYYGGANISSRYVYFNLLIHNISLDTRSPYIKSNYFYLSSQNSYYFYYTYFTNNYGGYSPYNEPLSHYKPNYYGLMYGPATLFSINYTRFGQYGTPQYSLSVSDYSSNFTSTESFHNFGITVTYFYTYYCPYTTPYLLDTTCYDICPNSSNSNEATLTCNSTPIAKESLNPVVLIGSILAFVCFILIIALIIILFCLFKKMKKEPQPKYVVDRSLTYDEVEPGSNTPSDTKMIAPVKPTAESEIGVWREKSMDASAECSLCHNRRTFLRTECGHSFHVKCIVEWSNRYENCPNCTEKLNQKYQRLLCRFCKSKEKWMKFRAVKTKFQENALSTQFICPSCLMTSY